MLKRNFQLLSIIIPCYNEEKNIKYCINTIPINLGLQYEILVVDDGSSDNTVNIVKKIKRNKSKYN